LCRRSVDSGIKQHGEKTQESSTEHLGHFPQTKGAVHVSQIPQQSGFETTGWQKMPSLSSLIATIPLLPWRAVGLSPTRARRAAGFL
jgi:hypothetical protein